MEDQQEQYRSLFDLSGAVAVVTGGAGTIGSECCKGLAAHGSDVVVVDVDGAAAAELADETARRYGVRAIGVGCDVSSAEEVDAMVGRVASEMGRLDVLHNNAAWKSDDLEAFFKATEGYSLEQWRRVMSVNLDGAFLVARSAGKYMIEQGRGGSIVQTASIYGVVGPDNRIYEGSHYLGGAINTPAVYAASKGGIVALTRYLATTWAKHGIRVNTLTPGGVKSGQNAAFEKRYSSRVPLKRMAQPSDVVGALVYLASGASSYVTGQNLCVDGGWTAW